VRFDAEDLVVMPQGGCEFRKFGIMLSHTLLKGLT